MHGLCESGEAAQSKSGVRNPESTEPAPGRNPRLSAPTTRRFRAYPPPPGRNQRGFRAYPPPAAGTRADFAPTRRPRPKHRAGIRAYPLPAENNKRRFSLLGKQRFKAYVLFLAVLGDQTHGNNIEAPEGLIRKIVREESGGSSEIHVTIVLDSVTGKKLFDTVVRENNAVVRATGASPLVM